MGAGGASSLGNLTDVVITSPTTGNLIVYNGSEWVNTFSVDENFVITDTASGSVGGFTFTPTGVASDEASYFYNPEGVAFGLDPVGSPIFLVNSFEDIQYNGRNFDATMTGTLELTSTGNMTLQAHTVLSSTTALSFAPWTFFAAVVVPTPTAPTHAATKGYVDTAIALDLPDLGDVNIPTTPLDGDVIQYNAGTGQWVNQVIMLDLNDLDDVNVPSPSVDHFFYWTGTRWQAKTLVGLLGLDDLSDVDLTTTAPNTGDHLEYDGADWVPATPASGGITESLCVIGQNLNHNMVSTNSPMDWGSILYDRNSDFSYTSGVVTLPANKKCLIEWVLHLDTPNDTGEWFRAGWQEAATSGGTWATITTETSSRDFYHPDSAAAVANSAQMDWSESGSFVYDTGAAGNHRFLRFHISTQDPGSNIDAVVNGASLKITTLE